MPLCKEVFSQKFELINHIANIHSKNFKCIYCGEKFYLRHEFTNHMNSDHVGLKNEKCACGICGKVLGMILHKKSH